MSDIIWSDEDIQDPYPAIIETLGEVLRWEPVATGDDPTVGIIGGSEPDTLAAMLDACIEVLREQDPHSLKLLTGDSK